MTPRPKRARSRLGPSYVVPKPDLGRPLSRRERQTLIAAMLGATADETAHWMHISTLTVMQHRGRYIAKLGARSTTHAAVLALAGGLVTFADLCLDQPTPL